MAGLATVLPLVLTAASTIIGVVDSIRQGQAYSAAAKVQEQAGQYRKQLAERQAQAMELQAGQERAVSQRAAIAAREKGRRVSSEAQAIAAASGAGALDPTVIGILGDLDTETEIRTLTALYEGEETAKGLEYGALLERAGGEGQLYAARAGAAASRAAAGRSYLRAGGTILSGGAGLYDKYADAFPSGGGKIPPIPRRNPFYG